MHLILQSVTTRCNIFLVNSAQKTLRSRPRDSTTVEEKEKKKKKKEEKKTQRREDIVSSVTDRKIRESGDSFACVTTVCFVLKCFA